MVKSDVIPRVEERVFSIYKNKLVDLPYHDWKHIYFVYKNAVIFANELKANVFFVSIAALTHDLNYVVKKISGVEEGEKFRHTLLKEYKFADADIFFVEKIIQEATTSRRHANICDEAKALSDADTLYKALPITPIMFAEKYASEQKMNIYELAHKIISQQKPLLDEGIYFYSESAKKYTKWAETNLSLWQNVIDFQKNLDMLTLLLSRELICKECDLLLAKE